MMKGFEYCACTGERGDESRRSNGAIFFSGNLGDELEKASREIVYRF
jgi:hypothetical protein